MIEPGALAAVLLCAGLSRRFGAGDKLLAPLAGKPLLLHAATLVAAIPVRRRIAVVPTGPADEGVSGLLRPLAFERVENPNPANGKDSSLRFGLAAALEGECDAVLVCLGDMPCITLAHIAALCDTADSGHPAVSSCEDWWSPPLILPRAVAERAMLKPDTPVHAVVDRSGVRKVPATYDSLADIDTQHDFQALEARFANRPNRFQDGSVLR